MKTTGNANWSLPDLNDSPEAVAAAESMASAAATAIDSIQFPPDA